jgi:hypothetical protein
MDKRTEQWMDRVPTLLMVGGLILTMITGYLNMKATVDEMKNRLAQSDRNHSDTIRWKAHVEQCAHDHGWDILP